MMYMETDSTVVPRRPVEDEAIHGRVTGLQRDHSLDLLVALLRGHPVRTTAREVDSVDIGVVGVVAVGGFIGSLRLRLLLTMWLLRLRQILLSLRILLRRQWRW